MKGKGYPLYAIIKKGGLGVPHQPSNEAQEFIEKHPYDRKLPFPDSQVKEGQLIQAGQWMFVLQYKRKGSDWRDWTEDVMDFSEPLIWESGEEYRYIYRLRR